MAGIKNTAVLILIFMSAAIIGLSKGIAFEKEKLENGLTLIYHSDKSLPYTSVLCSYGAGSLDDNSAKTGTAFIAEKLARCNYKGLSSAARDSLLRYTNGKFESNASYDNSCYYIEMPAGYLKSALFLQLKIMNAPDISAGNVLRAKQLALNEISRLDSMPYKMARQMEPKILFDAWPVYGDKAHYDKISGSDLKSFYDELYIPSNCIMVITGPQDTWDMKKYARQFFKKIQSPPKPERQSYKIPKLSKDYRAVFEDEFANKDALLALYRASNRHDSLYFPYVALAEILAGNSGSYFAQELIYGDELAEKACAKFTALDSIGGISLFISPARESGLSELEERMFELIAELIEDGADEEKIDAAMKTFTTKYHKKLNCPMGLSLQLAEFECFFGGAEMINDYEELVTKVKAEEINKALKAAFGTERRALLEFEAAR